MKKHASFFSENVEKIKNKLLAINRVGVKNFTSNTNRDFKTLVKN
jgi:hypothetical protein